MTYLLRHLYKPWLAEIVVDMGLMNYLPQKFSKLVMKTKKTPLIYITSSFKNLQSVWICYGDLNNYQNLKARGLLFQNIQSLNKNIKCGNYRYIPKNDFILTEKKILFFFCLFSSVSELELRMKCHVTQYLFIKKKKKYSFSYMQNHYKYFFWWITYLSPLPLNFFLPIVLILILPNQKRLNKTQSHQNMIPKWSVHVHFLPNFIIFVAFYKKNTKKLNKKSLLPTPLKKLKGGISKK